MAAMGRCQGMNIPRTMHSTTPKDYLDENVCDDLSTTSCKVVSAVMKCTVISLPLKPDRNEIYTVFSVFLAFYKLRKHGDRSRWYVTCIVREDQNSVMGIATDP